MTARIGVLLVALAAVAGDAGAQQRASDRDREGARLDTVVAFAGGGTVEVSLPHGRSADLVVTGWDRAEVRVRGETSRGTLTVDGDARRLEVRTQGDRGAAYVDDLELFVPRGTRLRVSNGSGDVTVRGTRGGVEVTTFNGDITVEDAADRSELRTFNGDVEVRRVAGRLHVNAHNGDVEVDEVNGELDVSTLNGDVQLLRVTGPRLRAKTMSGEISFAGALDPRGEYDFNAFSGGIDLSLPRNTAATLTVNTYNGTLDSPDFPLTLKPSSGAGTGSSGKSKSMTFDLGAGGARVSLESFSGEIRIRELRAASSGSR